MSKAVINKFTRSIRHFAGKILRSISRPARSNSNRIQHGENVEFGENCLIIHSKLGNNNRIGAGSFFDNVEYGDYTYNSFRATIINCRIGKFCSIAQDVSIGLGKHPVNEFVSTHPAFYSIYKQCGYTFADKSYFNETGHVEIGNDVWIGTNSIILDDVKIGNGAVIAANSLVNSNIPAYAIVGGTPAKILKYRFSQDHIDFLERFKWWSKDEEWLKANFKKFHNINSFMENFINDHR